MAKTITLAELSAERANVELFGHTYVVREIVRSVQRRLEQVDGKLKEADENDSDAVIAIMAEALDTLLEPALSNGTKPVAAKKVLVDAWKQDKLSVNQAQTLFESLQAAAAERPT